MLFVRFRWISATECCWWRVISNCSRDLILNVIVSSTMKEYDEALLFRRRDKGCVEVLGLTFERCTVGLRYLVFAKDRGSQITRLRAFVSQ